MKTRQFSDVVAIVIGVALACSVPSIYADESANTQRPSVTVQYEDLDLSTAAGVERLYQRISTAARNVCGPGEHHRNIDIINAWEQCYNGAVDNAVASVGQPALTRYHVAKTGRQVKEEPQVVTTK